MWPRSAVFCAQLWTGTKSPRSRFSVIGTVVATGLVIVLMIQRATTEAGNDRRAFQAGMDDFRREMLRLAERQARIEGNPAE